jgi:hypothetical protein
MQTSFEGFNETNSHEKQDYEDSDNTLLFEDQLYAQVYGVSHHPALTINGQIYRGDLAGYDIYRAICASFYPTNRPEECSKDYDI